MPFVNDPSKSLQILKAKAGDRAQDQIDLQNNLCPSCLHLFWVISPETSEKLEGG